MLRFPVLLDERGTVNIDYWDEVKLGRGEHSLVLLVVLEVALMQQLQADEQRYLRGEELSGVRGACYQDCGGAI